MWHRDRIKGDNGAWSVDIWVSSKWGTQKHEKLGCWKPKIVNCWHIPWVKNILRHTHLPNQLNGQNLIGMPVLFPQFGMNPFLFINTRSPGRCWIYPFWGPRIIVWGWDIQSNWFGSTPTLGFGAAVASGIQGYHSRSSTCCQKSHPSKVILEESGGKGPHLFSHLHNWWLPHKDQPGFSEAKLSWGGISSYPNVWEVQCSMIVFLVFINLYISKFYQLIYRSFWPFYIFYPYFGTSKTPLNTFMLRLEGPYATASIKSIKLTASNTSRISRSCGRVSRAL